MLTQKSPIRSSEIMLPSQKVQLNGFSLGSLQWVSDTLGPPSQANGNHSVIAPLWILLVTRQ